MKIKAAVTESKGGPFLVQELELGELRADEVLVEVGAAGICHTDLICRDQWLPVPLPAVLGHEGAGVVKEVGSAVTAVSPGDRVAMSFDSCGACPTCTGGRPPYCHAFFARNLASTRADGTTSLSRNGDVVHSHFFGQSSFATHAVAAARSVVRLPDSIELTLAAPFGCGVQTGAGGVLNVLRPPAGSSLAVFGTGTVGLASILAALVAGCTTIIGVDRWPIRLELARELGATHVVDVADGDAVEAIRRITGAGVDFSLETTGSTQVLRQAVDCTAPTGVCGVIGAPPFGAEVALDVHGLIAPGRTVRGILEGDSIPQLFIPVLIRLWEQGRFPVERLTTLYDFDRINDAVHDAEAGTTIKPVLQM